MTNITTTEMIEKAIKVLNPQKLGSKGSSGSVACALLSENKNLYFGVCIDVISGMGFCAEHSAIASMITAGETHISKIVAVWQDGTILPPCGRCREFINQINFRNLDNTEVILGSTEIVKLKELLPHPCQEIWNE